MILSKGSYENYLKTVVDVFGFETPGSISRQEMFFYLDSLYRGLPKVLILQGYSKSTQEEGNVRLDFRDINKFIEMLFEDQ